jgi:hypothetical protein
MPTFNSAKSAELQVIAWFLEAGWEVFTPVVDANQTDAVVRIPATEELLAIQIKHKEPQGLNEGQLLNKWRTGKIQFHFLVIYQPAKVRGVILWKEDLQTVVPRQIVLFTPDRNGYSNGPIRPKYKDVAFDFKNVDATVRAGLFTDLLLKNHKAPKPMVRPIP